MNKPVWLPSSNSPSMNRNHLGRESSRIHQTFRLLQPWPTLCVCVCVCLFRATPEAYGSFQARGRIGAATAGLHHSHSNAGSKLRL